MSSPPRLYPTDLTDAEWQILEPLVPAAKAGGRPPKWTRRAILDGVSWSTRWGWCCELMCMPRTYRIGGPQVLEGVKERFGRLAHIWLDQGYTGAGKAWIEQELGWSVEIVKHAPRPRGIWVFPGQEVDPTIFQRPKGFRHLPRRWVVERTFSWFGQARRLSKDYERLPETEEAMIYITMSRLMLRRLARAA